MEIYNESCLDTLKRLENNSVDIVITSPPYNLDLKALRNGKYVARKNPGKLGGKYNSFSDGMPLDEYYEFHKAVIFELLRVSEVVFYNIQIVTGSKKAFFKIIGEFSDYLKEIIIWDKANSQPAMSEGVINRQTELLLVFDSKNSIFRKFQKCNFKRGTMTDIWKIKNSKNKFFGHGATFPEELVEKILINFSNEGDTVYDPFAGTGTTAVVSEKLNRKWLCSETSTEYCDIIKNRITNLRLTLF